MDIHLGGLHRVILVVNGRSGTGKIIDLVNFHIQGEGDVVAEELKVRVLKQMQNVSLAPRVEVVHTEDILALFQQMITQMGAKESSTAGYKDAFLIVTHCLYSPKVKSITISFAKFLVQFRLNVCASPNPTIFES